MPAWALILIVLAGAVLVLLFVIRVRYQVKWATGSSLTGSVELGLPGLIRAWRFPGSPSVQSADEPGASKGKTQKQGTDHKRNPISKRSKRALFLFCTDRVVLAGLLAHSLKSLRRVFALLDLEFTGRLSLSNPATLGRMAGTWHAVHPILGKRVNVEFDFEPMRFGLSLQARGGFSLARALACTLLILLSFPWLRLARRAWRAWKLARTPRFTGWREWVYRRAGAFPRMGGIS